MSQIMIFFFDIFKGAFLIYSYFKTFKKSFYMCGYVKGVHVNMFIKATLNFPSKYICGYYDKYFTR